MADNTFVPVPDAIKQKLSEGEILESYTFAEIDRIFPSRFLRGSDWDSLNLPSSESNNCGIAFDNLCLLAWEKDNLHGWQIESELEQMVSG
ncbi:hypothetical protein BTUL_0125g00130 [Botrytis tulipae]|uniref:Uncharacterized protein n=1 Tax=Botrytis tulipae TaxID=87230 RepID=A0A4Z1EHB2_9HELO|nr:hypothetical protein BTUL_0125g00130 [Botrytis tulipae]